MLPPVDVDWGDETTWPGWMTEGITLVDHDPVWLARGEEEAERLTGLLDAHAVTDVQHIGSTAVPGLPAKPILDFAVASEDRNRTATNLAAQLDDTWVLVPDGLHPLPIRLLIRVVDAGTGSPTPYLRFWMRYLPSAPARHRPWPGRHRRGRLRPGLPVLA